MPPPYGGKGIIIGAAPPFPSGACGVSILVHLALAHHSKILDLPLAPATVLATAPTSAPSLGRWLEAAPVTVTSAAAVAQAVAWSGSQPSGPQRAQSDRLQKVCRRPSRVSRDGRWAERNRFTRLLIIDSSCILQSFNRQLAYSQVLHFTYILACLARTSTRKIPTRTFTSRILPLPAMWCQVYGESDSYKSTNQTMYVSYG